MTWFKVDDGFWSHPKTFALSPEAVALWVRAGSYCGKHLTDGFVPRQVLAILQGTEGAAVELVTAGLWWPVDDGWTFHDWNTYQDTKDVVEARRAAWKNQKQGQRTRKRENGNTPSLISIPFLSKGSTDTGTESGAESGTDKCADPQTIATVMEQWRTRAHTTQETG